MNALDAIAFIAERKIEEAMAEGAFDNLPGLGKPLHLEDLSHMPADMRMAYTILKNSGHLNDPAQNGRAGRREAEPDGAKRMPCSMKELMAALPDEGRVYGKMQRLNVMMARVRKMETLFLPERAGKKGTEERAPARGTDDSPYLEQLLKKV